MSDASGTISLSQVLDGVGAQMASSLQDIQRLESLCLKACPGEGALQLQGFDKIAQILVQLAECCEQLSHENTVRNVQVQRSIVDRLTLEEVRQRLLAEPVQVSASSGDMEFF